MGESVETSPLPGSSKDPAGTKWRHKLEFLTEVIVGVDLLAVLAASIVVTKLVTAMDRENPWLSFLSESKAAVATLGAFYSFALVFRTNICYARWWEGRTLWGVIIVNSIRIAQQARLWIEDEALVHRLDSLAITFAYASKAVLRGNAIEDDDEDGSYLVLKGIISKEELSLIASQSAWQPYYCSDAMRATINEGLNIEKDEQYPTWRKNVAQQAMEHTICTLADSVGGCIRVRSTGLPVAYDDILNTMGALFFTAACAAWAPGAGSYNPIVVLVTYVVAKMIVSVGNDMEDPFGFDESDLPLEKFCATIERQVAAISERACMMKFNLAYGPPSSQQSNRSYSTFSPVTTRSHTPESQCNSLESGSVEGTDPALF